MKDQKGQGLVEWVKEQPEGASLRSAIGSADNASRASLPIIIRNNLQ